MVMKAEPILQVEKLTFGYQEGEPVLRDISFSLETNQPTVLLGPNGAGKSTLMFNLLGLYKPGAGEIFFQGQSLESLGEETLRQKLAYIFQNPDDQVFAPTVREDILFGPLQFGMDSQLTTDRLTGIVEQLQISHLLERNPRHLSYGEKRRVALAGVLIMEPEIIFFDEPLAFLDPPGRKLFIEILAQLKREGKSLFVATHDLNFAAEWGERFLVLHDGEILSNGDRRLFQKGIEAFGEIKPLVTQIFEGYVKTAELPVTVAGGRELIAKLQS